MFKVNGLEKEKDYKYPRPTVNCQHGDDQEFLTKGDFILSQVHETQHQGIPVWRDYYRRINIGGELGVLPCKRVNIAVGRSEAVPEENSYQIHTGGFRNEPAGLRSSQFVKTDNPILKQSDIFNAGFVSPLAT